PYDALRGRPANTGYTQYVVNQHAREMPSGGDDELRHDVEVPCDEGHEADIRARCQRSRHIGCVVGKTSELNQYRISEATPQRVGKQDGPHHPQGKQRLRTPRHRRLRSPDHPGYLAPPDPAAHLKSHRDSLVKRKLSDGSERGVRGRRPGVGLTDGHSMHSLADSKAK